MEWFLLNYFFLGHPIEWFWANFIVCLLLFLNYSHVILVMVVGGLLWYFTERKKRRTIPGYKSPRGRVRGKERKRELERQLEEREKRRQTKHRRC